MSLLRPEVCLSSLQLVWGQNSRTEPSATCYDGCTSGVFKVQGCASPRDSFNSKKGFNLEQFKMGLARGQSAPGLLVQRQAFQKILWSGSQADLARWLPSQSATETRTTQPPRKNSFQTQQFGLMLAVNSDRTQMLLVADKT